LIGFKLLTPPFGEDLSGATSLLTEKLAGVEQQLNRFTTDG
jgi:hypothetical protein